MNHFNVCNYQLSNAMHDTTPPPEEPQFALLNNLASRWKRLGGALIDTAIATSIVAPVWFTTDVFQRAMRGETLSTAEHLWYCAVGWVIFLALNGLLLFRKGQTIGKYLLKTRIVDKEGNLPTFSKLLLLRYGILGVLVQIPVIGLFFQAIYLFVGIPLIFGKNRRCLHDYMAGTWVINDTARTKTKLMNTVQMVCFWYTGVAVVTVLLDRTESLWVIVLAILHAGSVMFLTYRPNDKVNKKVLAAWIIIPAILLGLGLLIPEVIQFRNDAVLKLAHSERSENSVYLDKALRWIEYRAEDGIISTWRPGTLKGIVDDLDAAGFTRATKIPLQPGTYRVFIEGQERAVSPSNKQYFVEWRGDDK